MSNPNNAAVNGGTGAIAFKSSFAPSHLNVSISLGDFAIEGFDQPLPVRVSESNPKVFYLGISPNDYQIVSLTNGNAFVTEDFTKHSLKNPADVEAIGRLVSAHFSSANTGDDPNVTNVTSASPNVTSVTENDAQVIDYDESDASDASKLISAQIFQIKKGIEKLPDDPGAIFTSEALEAWSALFTTNPDQYQRLRAEAKAAKGRVTDLDNTIKFFIKKTRTNSNSNVTNVTSIIGKGFQPIGTSLDGLETSLGDDTNVTSVTRNVTANRLVFIDERGKPKPVIESKAARIVSSAFQGRYFHDQEADVWHKFTGTHWSACPRGFALKKALVRWFEKAMDPIGFKPGYMDGVLRIVTDGNFLEAPAQTAPAMPFANGQLDLATGQLDPTTPGNAQTWVLPYSYHPDADCPAIKKWLRDSVGGDDDIVELLRAVLAALLHGGAKYQKFLSLLGRGGTGKSTFLRLVSKMIGDSNTTTTTLKQLEGNRFEAAALYGKRLALITDSDKYGGALNTLKAITGQDKVRLEEKNKQQGNGFVFEGMVFIASNEHITSTDYAGGALERRRITVNFDHVPTVAEKLEWEKNGGEDALHSEIPGLVNWLLQLSDADIQAILDNPSQATREANFEAMTANSPLAEWVTAECVPDTAAWTQIGEKNEIRLTNTDKGEDSNTSTSTVIYQFADCRLYPNYLTWCLLNGREALSKRRFKGLVIDTIKTLGYSSSDVKRSAGAGIAGLRLKESGEVFDWLNHRDPVDSNPVDDVEEF